MNKLREHPIGFFTKHQISARQAQVEVLDQVHKAWDHFNFLAINAPTGVGKTYIATSIAAAAKDAYILTSTLQLQTQYEKSWNDLVNLKGRGNYACQVNQNFQVDAAPCSVSSELMKVCRREKTCTYYNQKDLAMASQSMITNPMYLLYSAHCGVVKGDEEEGDWSKRAVMIIDEAHGLEGHLTSFAESTINPEDYQKEYGIRAADFIFTGRVDDDYVTVTKLYEVLQEKASALASKIESEMPAIHGDPKAWARGISSKAAERVAKLRTRAYALDKIIQPLKIFYSTHSSVDELARRWLIAKVDGQNVLKLSPLYCDFLFTQYFGKLADKFVFMSATLGSKKEFAKVIGVEQDKLHFIDVDSPFDPTLSPVIVSPQVRLSRDHYQDGVKKLGGVVDEILTMHEGQRGLIHAATYDLTTQIFQRVSPKHNPRLLCRDMDSMSGKSVGKFPKRYKNDELLELHTRRGPGSGSVLVSPSMMEGVDLHGDLADFQIIVKMPWANLGDPRIKVKSQLDPDWYSQEMWIKVLQAAGRSTRHETDTSVTYVLDASFPFFYEQKKHELPTWFKRRVIF